MSTKDMIETYGEQKDIDYYDILVTLPLLSVEDKKMLRNQLDASIKIEERVYNVQLD